MQTPKQYMRNLKNGIITTRMIEDCLFSVNKRAKNCRDKIREYKQWQRFNRYLDVWDYINKYDEQMDEYYSEKETLLTLLKPTCIHIEALSPRHNRNNDSNRQTNRYYLLYKLPHHTFHTPINALNEEHLTWTDEEKRRWICDNYGELPIVELQEQIVTKGHKVDDLISCQFVKKVLKLIESGTYSFVEEVFCDKTTDEPPPLKTAA